MSYRSLAARTLVAALLPLAACTQNGVTPPTPAGAALTSLPRELSPAEQSVRAASNAFSFALWHAINAAQRDANVFTSPLSASYSLGMAMNGAAGQTLDEMRAGLRFGTESLASIDNGYKSLTSLLTSLDPGVRLDVANSIWYRQGLSVNQSFLDDGANYFGATIKPLDFANTGASLTAINGWVNANTNGRIPTILDQIDPSDMMFLINAIYFKGSWRVRFDPNETQTAPFHSVQGDQAVRLMHREGTVAMAVAPTYTAVDLPYGDSAFTMTVVLPKQGTSADALAASLTAESWQSLTSSLRTALVDLYLPRLTMQWERELIPDLTALGMHEPFNTSGADFIRMSARGHELYISAVKQKTVVDINEEGTEAAAVTSTGIRLTSAIIPIEVRVDRPFLFVIRERLSGTVLFMGKVVRLP